MALNSDLVSRLNAMCPAAKAAELGSAVSALQTAAVSGAADLAALQIGAVSAAADLAAVTAGKGASLVGIEDAGGKFAATTVEAALAEVKTVADAGMAVTKQSLTIGFADFAALGEADFVALDVGAALPANARLVGFEIADVTAFDDGGASVDVKVRLGIGVSTAVVMGDFDVDTTAAGAVGIGTPGTRGFSMAPVGGDTIIATVTTNNAAHLAGLDAGAMTINVFYIVLA